MLRPDAAAQAIAVPGLEGIRVLTDDNALIAGPDNITPQSTFERFGQFRDDLNYATGSHLIRGGVDVVYYRVPVTNFVNGFPQFNVVSPASRNPADIANQTFINTTLGNKNGKRIPGHPDNSHRNTRISGYAEDTWRIQPNLMLNYGFRYEVDTHPLNNDLDKPALVGPILPDGTAATPIDKNNIAPHVGHRVGSMERRQDVDPVGRRHLLHAAHQQPRDQRARVDCAVQLRQRHDHADRRGHQPAAAGLQPGRRRRLRFFPALVPGTTVANAVPIILQGQNVYVAAPPSTTPTLDITRTGLVISNDLETPYSKQFNFGVQRELPFRSMIDVNFIYSRTEHEFMRDIDAANFFPGNGAPIVLGDGRAPTNAITKITSNGFSEYKALTVKFDKRLSNHYQFGVSMRCRGWKRRPPTAWVLAPARSSIATSRRTSARAHSTDVIA